MDERTRQEIYYPPFLASVRAGAGAHLDLAGKVGIYTTLCVNAIADADQGYIARLTQLHDSVDDDYRPAGAVKLVKNDRLDDRIGF